MTQVVVLLPLGKHTRQLVVRFAAVSTRQADERVIQCVSPLTPTVAIWVLLQKVKAR